jgi:hypothetical protein
MSEFKGWEELSELEQLAAEYSDYFKSAYGYRPRGIDTCNWTVEQFNAEFEVLAAVCKGNEIARKQAEAAAAVVVEARIADLIKSGAADRATAVRWIDQAEGSNGDMSYLCFLLGVDYGYFDN